jgi:hypothetical protein
VRFARAIALAVGAFYLFTGLWAFLAPAGFYGAVASFSPYNQHLLHDAGAFQVGLGLVLVLGAMSRAALRPALLAVLAASVLHLVAHVQDRALGGHATDVPVLSLICGLLAVAAVLEVRHGARRIST